VEPNPITDLRVRAYELADAGKLKSWAAISRALAVEGYSMFLLRQLEGDSYLKFRLRQRIKAAQGKPDA
jgi:hypothetical protein